MASADIDGMYSICYMDGSIGSEISQFRASELITVSDLHRSIRQYWSYAISLEKEQLLVFKCGDVNTDPLETLYERVSVWLHTRSPEDAMKSHKRLNEYFPGGPNPNGGGIVDVIAAAATGLEVRDQLSDLPTNSALMMNKVRADRIKGIKDRFPGPSDGLKNIIRVVGAIHARRPAGNYGPPTAIFSPVLARLRKRLENLDSLPELKPSTALLKTCHELIKMSCEIYQSEKTRQNALKEAISNLMVGKVAWQQATEDKKAKPDATWGDPIYALLELKNEPGQGGSASVQGSIDYVHVIGQQKYQKHLESSNLPVIIIGLMGNHLEISTAIYTDGIYVDKLFSEDLILDARQADQVLRLGRVAMALKLTSAELSRQSQSLRAVRNPSPSTKHLYPNPVPMSENVTVPNLAYFGKLSRDGECINILDVGDLEERPRTVYLAKMRPSSASVEEIDVVVKFAYRYNVKAHKILAMKGLAPNLHHCIPVIGSLNLVIMDRVKGRPLPQSFIPRDYKSIYQDVNLAVTTLHEHNMVFGDLYVKNILLTEGGKHAMLVDFGLAGEDGKDRYPASWSTTIDWATGVDKWTLMKKEHDLEMLGKVEGFLEDHKEETPPHEIF